MAEIEIGIMAATTTEAMAPAELAVACEERGFESYWVPEHTHIPASRRTPFPGGGELPREYSSLQDPFVCLAAAAARTERIKLGTSVCLVVEHDPITLAKTVASLDQLSNGRFLFGIGGGWNAEEMENHGTEFSRRWKLLRERVEAMKVIWTEDEAEYHGEFVRFDPIWANPKPVQKPHPPILLGSATESGRKRAVRYCDGWMPTGIPHRALPSAIADLRAKAESAGRDPAEIEITLFWARPRVEVLEELAGLGVARAIFAVPSAGADEVLPRLDRYAALAAKMR